MLDFQEIAGATGFLHIARTKTQDPFVEILLSGTDFLEFAGESAAFLFKNIETIQRGDLVSSTPVAPDWGVQRGWESEVLLLFFDAVWGSWNFKRAMEL